MTKELQDKIRQEKLGLTAYATEKLNEAYPEHTVKIEHVAIDAQSKRRWFTAYIGNELAFGKGESNYQAVANLKANFSPKTAEQKAEHARTHSSNLVQMFSDHA